VASADTEKPPDGPVPNGPRAATGSPDVSTPENDQDADSDGPAVDGDQPDADSEEDAVDSDGDGGEEPSGVINDEISGKTVQAISIDPDSKILPGAKEIILSFNESTDSLRILCTATGQVKFYWRKQLMDLP